MMLVTKTTRQRIARILTTPLSPYSVGLTSIRSAKEN